MAKKLRNPNVRVRIKRATSFEPGQKNSYFGDVYTSSRCPKNGRKLWRKSPFWFRAESLKKADSGEIRDSVVVLFGPNQSSLTFLWNNESKSYFCPQNGIEGTDLEDLFAKFIPTNDQD